MNIKDTFMKLGHFDVKDGSQTRFWLDTWLGNKPLKDKFPALCNIVRRKHDTIATVMSSPILNISFRRNLVGANLTNWHRIVASLQQVNLIQQRDVFVWGLKASGVFTVKSMYAALINNGVRVSQDIWQTKLPMKIKIFMWYLKKGVTLTKDNLARRNWSGDKSSCFCHFSETIYHLFFDCFYAKFLWRSIHLLFGLLPPTDMADLFVRWFKLGNKKYNTLLLTAAAALLWAIWLTRNEIVFDKCKLKSLLQVLF